MKFPILTSLVIALSVFSNPSANAEEVFLKYPEAVAAAKEKNCDVILLSNAPNIVPDAAAVRRVFASSDHRAAIGNKAIWSAIEATESISKEPVKRDKNAAPDFTVWNLPAVLVIAPDGHVFAVAEGLRAKSAATVIKQIPALLESRKKRDALWEKARAASGVERANLYGQGLDLMYENCARARKDIVDEMRKTDPKDESGYILKYTFDGNEFHGKIVDIHLKENKIDELLSIIDGYLKNPRLSVRQKQVVLTGRFQVMTKKNRIPEALEELKSIIKLNPKNDMGRGAAQFIKYYTEPVRLTQRSWSSSDNRPIWLPMVVNVSDIVKTAGTYEIEFKLKTGNTRFSKTELTAGGKIIASDENQKEQRKLRLVVKEAPEGRVELRANALGTGWFDGTGDILVTKVD